MDGKVIVVTGALGALGRVVVDEALGRGARIASVDHAPTQVPAISIPPEVRHNVFLAFKEALNNVVRHSEATEVGLAIEVAEDDSRRRSRPRT